MKILLSPRLVLSLVAACVLATALAVQAQSNAGEVKKRAKDVKGKVEGQYSDKPATNAPSGKQAPKKP
jgi:hypothetical protein